MELLETAISESDVYTDVTTGTMLHSLVSNENDRDAGKAYMLQSGIYVSAMEHGVLNGIGDSEMEKKYQIHLNEIKNHLTNDVDGLAFEPNNAMLKKIEELLSDKKELTGAYKDFYDHELTESMLMKQNYEYKDAHEMSLEIHNVEPQALYSPEIIQEFYMWFNKSDYEYWGITIKK